MRSAGRRVEPAGRRARSRSGCRPPRRSRRTLTGTSATGARDGRSPVASNSRPSMPATAARIASLTVPPAALAAALSSASDGARHRVAAVGPDAAVEERHRRLRAVAGELGEQLGRAAQVAAARSGSAVSARSAPCRNRRWARSIGVGGELGEVPAAVVGPRRPAARRAAEVHRLGRGVEQDRPDADRGHAVDERVVHLRHERDAPPRRPSTTSAPTAAASGRAAATSRCRRAGRSAVAGRGTSRGARASRVEALSSTQTGLVSPGAGCCEALAVARDQVQPRSRAAR